MPEPDNPTDQPAAGTADMVVQASIADARLQGDARLGRGVDPRPGEPYRDIGPGDWMPDDWGLPPDCPIEPLGAGEGVFWFLDTIGRHKSIADGSLNQGTIRALFMGRPNYLIWAWPKRDKEGVVRSWRPERCAEDLATACAMKGAWDPVNKIRGTGAWSSPDGSLIYHDGERLWIDGDQEQLGIMDGMVYPAMSRIPRPWPQPIEDQHNPVRWLLPLLRRWYWDRPETDPVLLLGWIAAAMIGGALKFRPPMVILGDYSYGKTELQRLIKALMGDGLVQAADSTAAGVYQHVGLSSLAVALDEFEPGVENQRQRAVLDLMRLAASGAVMLRGGAEHRGTQFTARSAFFFSAINAPPLKPAELSRLAILKLLQLPADAKAFELDQERLALAGRQLLRIIMDRWHQLPAKLEAYRTVMTDAGHSGRGKDVFGTLLAMAELVIGDLYEELDVEMGDNLSVWSTRLAVRNLMEYDDQVPNWWRCLSHLLNVQVEVWRSGAQLTVGQVLEELKDPGNNFMTFDQANTLLRKCGLSLKRPVVKGELVLGVPNQNPATRRLFVGSDWAGEEGSSVWSWALRQGPSELWKAGPVKINMVSSRGTWIDLNELERFTPEGLSAAAAEAAEVEIAGKAGPPA